MYRRFAVLFLFLNILLAAAAQTTPQTPGAQTNSDSLQEAVVIDQISNRIRYDADGTGEHVVSTVIRVQSEAAVRELGQLIFGYNSGFETLTVDYVRVRKASGEVLPTPSTSLQDFAPEILKSAPMYSDYREKHVSVVGLRPGDILEYQTTTHINSALVPGEFWYEHSFPKNVVVHEARLEVDVPKLRDIHLRSPEKKYESKEIGDRRVYTWVVHDIIPDRKPKKQAFDFSSEQTRPDVQLTTFNDWQQVAHWYAKLQGQQVVTDDAIRKKADELTRGSTTPTDKAQRLYDFVARNIRYVSLSFGIGRYQPHTSTEVLQNGYGDCKDKHTLLAALLRAEGIQSYPVLIHHDVKLDPDVPSPAQFDHVITAALLGKGKDLTWLDSTTEVAPFGLIMYSLRNKQALLAADDSIAGLHRTPSDSPVKNTELLSIDGKFSETGTLDATVELTATGDSDYPLRMEFRSIPQPNWERFVDLIAKAWALPGEVSDVKLSALEDTSKPFHLHFKIHNDQYFTVPGRVDRAVPLPPILVKGESTKPSEPIDIGPAVERTYRAHLQFAPNYDVQPPLPVRISRAYGEYTATYTIAKNVLDAERHLLLKVNEVPYSQKSDVESLSSVQRRDATQLLTCVITPASREARAAAAQPAGESSDELLKAGNRALQRQDYKTASEVLKRLVDQEPKHEQAWDSLGRAYAGLNNHDEAIKAFQKQIEIDPYNQQAYRELGAELQQAGKNDEAVSAYRKHLEIVPLDGTAHKNLGLILASQKKDADARPELEAAARISPDDPEIKLALAEVYNRTGDTDKAQSLTKGVIGAGAAGDDIFSAALPDHDPDPNQSSQDARRTLDDIGDHFDSGDYNQLNASAFTAMRFVALAWARIGWAAFQGQEYMPAMQFLQSSWLLSRSGTVANRLARLYLAEGQRDKARHMFALATVAGGVAAANSSADLLKLSASPDEAQQEIIKATKEFVESRSIKLPGLAKTGTAQFNLLFDGSSQPERVQFVRGDESLRDAEDALMKATYPVKFPDVSSIKILHRGNLTCTGSECTLVLMTMNEVK